MKKMNLEEVITIEEMFSAMASLTKRDVQIDIAKLSLAFSGSIGSITKTTPETTKIFKSLGIETNIKAKELKQNDKIKK